MEMRSVLHQGLYGLIRFALRGVVTVVESERQALGSARQSFGELYRGRHRPHVGLDRERDSGGHCLFNTPGQLITTAL